MATEVVLDLTRHCIETAARREHRRLRDVLLQAAEPDGALEARLTLLQRFLEQTDFRRLRARDPRLCGGSPVRVAVRGLEGNGVGWDVLG